MAPTATRVDPLATFRFHVQIGEISEAMFTECSGLQAQIEVEEYVEGGANDRVRRLPGRAKFTNVTLKRGVCCSDSLWRWWNDVLQGKVARKEVTIALYSRQGEEVMRWTLADAFPVKWVAPPLKAAESTAAVESLELTYEGMRLG